MPVKGYIWKGLYSVLKILFEHKHLINILNAVLYNILQIVNVNMSSEFCTSNSCVSAMDYRCDRRLLKMNTLNGHLEHSCKIRDRSHLCF